MTLDGKILGTLGKSGHEAEAVQLDPRAGVPDGERAVVADMNNWRVQKVTLHPERLSTSTANTR